jgi:hypothetical protein
MLSKFILPLKQSIGKYSADFPILSQDKIFQQALNKQKIYDKWQ